MKYMKKSRKGVALILALIVVLVCGLLISGIFSFTNQYGVFSQAERGMYVDHTTLVSHSQIMKGRIVANNLARGGGNGAARHTDALNLKYADGDPESDLELKDLRFGGPDQPDDWYMYEEVSSGLGVQNVEVEVYDMFFEREWIKPLALENKDFPPTFNMIGEESGEQLLGKNEGEVITQEIEPGIITPGENIRPENYGAYLVRARLYDQHGRLLRTMEEAFVQILSPEE